MIIQQLQRQCRFVMWLPTGRAIATLLQRKTRWQQKQPLRQNSPAWLRKQNRFVMWLPTGQAVATPHLQCKTLWYQKQLL